MDEKELSALCAVVVKNGKATKEEKAVIAKECKERGIELNTKCANCYADAAAVIYSQLPKDEQQQNGRKWVLRPGVDVTFGGVRVCEATITDELAESIVARGFSKMFFATYPQQ